MKRIWYVFLSVLLLSSVFCFTAAAALPAVETVLSTETAAIGNTITADVVLSDNPGIAAINLRISYDNGLKLIGYEESQLTGWTVGVGSTTERGEKAIWADTKNWKKDGSILKLKFRVLDTEENRAGSTQTVTVSVEKAYSFEEEQVSFESRSASVSVRQKICSDGKHEWDTGIVTVPASRAKPGVRTFSCTACGIQKTEEIPALTPICIHTCSRCGGCVQTVPCAGFEKCSCADEAQAPAAVTVEGAAFTADVPDAGTLTLKVRKLESVGHIEENLIEQAKKSIADSSDQGLQMQAEKVMAVYDISLLDDSGNEYDLQDAAVEIVLPIGVDNAKKIKEGKMLLIHFGENGNTVYSFGSGNLTVDVTKGTITFTTGGFSPFALLADVTGYTVAGTLKSFGDSSDDVTIRLTENGTTEPAYEVIVAGSGTSYSIENVAAGTYTMTVAKKNHVTRSYTVTVSDGNVTQAVKIHLLGDVTGDGEVDAIDLSRVKAHIRRTKLITDEYLLQCANVIGSDSTVDALDLSRIKAHIRHTRSLW